MAEWGISLLVSELLGGSMLALLMVVKSLKLPHMSYYGLCGWERPMAALRTEVIARWYVDRLSVFTPLPRSVRNLQVHTRA